MAPSYHRLGDVPRKRHVAMRAADGALYDEELVGAEGFSGAYSLLYHRYAPTRVVKVSEAPSPNAVAPSGETAHRHHLLRTGPATAGRDERSARTCLFFNSEVRLSVSAFGNEGGPGDGIVRNGGADECHFVHEGGGRLESVFGVLDYREGDYVVIPRGTTYRWAPHAAVNRHLVVESPTGIRLPRRYQNDEGQLLEHAPYWERDFRRPLDLLAIDDPTPTDVLVVVGDRAAIYTLDHHPFDVAGWDGHLYPYAFSIHDFEPISGRQHQPPHVHQTFELQGAVICSFVPRRLDDGPDVITAPYNHANLDSDEILYYVGSEFFSRRGIEPGALSYHPRGIPHGPAPGVAEASIGRDRTEEIAVMVDTFRPLTMTAAADAFDDPSYPTSWLPS